jgi:phosphatidate cytidylyltransferase
MAFNWQTFRTRTLTGAIFIGVMLLGLRNSWAFLILFSVVHFGCWWEYLRLIEKIHKTVFHSFVKLGLMVIGYGLMLWFCGPVYEINGYGLRENLSFPVSGAGFAVLLVGIFQKTPVRLKSFGAASLGLLYLSLSLGLMIDFYSLTEIHIHDTMAVLAPDTIPLVIMVSIWTNDTMAYLVGSMIGKHSLSKISPRKTWEGTIGGIVLCVALVGFVFPPLALHFRGLSLSIFVASIALIASVTGTFGDLLESRLKRMANVKDSGNLMPGHGGFLDRFDSLLTSIPSVWVILHLIP